MTKADNGDKGKRRPQFFTERDVPESIEPPSEMVGLYTFSRDESASDADRTYTRRGVLTSEGWVPPVSKMLVHTVAKGGDGPNDLDAVGNFAVGKATRIAIDPRELRSQLSEQGEIIPDDVSPAFRSQYSDSVDIYIPAGLDEVGIAKYLRDCVRPATKYYLDEHNGAQPSQEQLADVLVEAYGVTQEAALETVKLAVED
jgi:hypothetical protein